jgi:hypothetical protein
MCCFGCIVAQRVETLGCIVTAAGVQVHPEMHRSGARPFHSRTSFELLVGAFAGQRLNRST